MSLDACASACNPLPLMAKESAAATNWATLAGDGEIDGTAIEANINFKVRALGVGASCHAPSTALATKSTLSSVCSGAGVVHCAAAHCQKQGRSRFRF